MRKYEYGYVETADGSQYDDYDFGLENIVPARYTHAIVGADEGNPYIEALPFPRHEAATMIQYIRSIPSYSFEKTKTMTKFEKMVAAGELRSLRFPLPFHSELEFNFYDALLTSYRDRTRLESSANLITYFQSDNEKRTNGILIGDSAAATNAGFSLIGYSGCGKSSAIKTLVSHYPQVIMHQFGSLNRFPQIVYLVVNCVANSNFSALYEGIGDAIDKAFGNTVPIYSKEIHKLNGLGKKAEKIKEYVEKFGIGIIIFDEIQLLDFSHTRENSFDSLMTLANRTKVAVAVVGTEDARDKMFKELRTSRRLGVMIRGNTYCENKNFFSFLVRQLMKYQWFDELIEPTNDLIDTLYDLTKGIIDQLVGIYHCMQIEYLASDEKPQIDSNFIKKVADKYYPQMQDVLSNLDDIDSKKLTDIKMSAEEKINALMAEQMQREKANQIPDVVENLTKVSFANVITNLQALYDFTDAQIEKAFQKVIVLKSSKDKTEKEISRLVLEQLNKAEPKKRKAKNDKVPDIDQMKTFLNIDGDESK